MSTSLINLSLRPFRNDNLYRLIYACCVGVLLVVSLNNLVLIFRHGWTLAAARGQLRGQRSALAELEQHEKNLEGELAAINSVRLQKQADFANAAILNRVFSWTQLLNELEKVVPVEVRLRAVRPAVGSRGEVDIRLDGAARNYEAFVELEESLMRSASFSRVYPGSERLEGAAYRPGAPPLPAPSPAPAAAGAAAGEVSFSLSCEYFPGGKPAEGGGPGGTAR